MHKVSAVPAKKGVPRRLSVDEAAAALLTYGPVTDGHSAEHGDGHAGGTCVTGHVVGQRPALDVSVRFVRRSDTRSHRWV